MAKCIKIHKTGKVIRVPDNVARDAVERGAAEFAPKKDWKVGGRVKEGGEGNINRSGSQPYPCNSLGSMGSLTLADPCKNTCCRRWVAGSRRGIVVNTDNMSQAEKQGFSRIEPETDPDHI